MAAKGTVAKTVVEQAIAQAFGGDYIGIVDKKIYVWANDGSEKVQICIALTCPKTQIDAPAPSGDILQCKIDPNGVMTDYTGVKGPIPQKPMYEISDAESQAVKSLMAELGITE